MHWGPLKSAEKPRSKARAAGQGACGVGVGVAGGSRRSWKGGGRSGRSGRSGGPGHALGPFEVS